MTCQAHDVTMFILTHCSLEQNGDLKVFRCYWTSTAWNSIEFLYTRGGQPVKRPRATFLIPCCRKAPHHTHEHTW